MDAQTTDERVEIFGMTPEERENALNVLWSECKSRAMSCGMCGLSATRTNVVFGEGDENSRLLFIGEGPGETEDETGRPFIGRAGQLLTQILSAVGIDRNDVYITNVVKCRPPGNRLPMSEEEAACDIFLQTQILLIKPAIMVLLGSTPTKWILKTTTGISKLRGRWFDWRGIAVMPMFHPSYLLRYSDDKRQGSPKHLSWLDIQEVRRQWDSVKETGRTEGIDFGG
ncbi:MAG: uracil-DNA glycosylase [Synergistaceae bacterium]|jgi:DNA polymerase|nr:uracil-DNA glycosylase [Synergistaceae bacterium]